MFKKEKNGLHFEKRKLPETYVAVNSSIRKVLSAGKAPIPTESEGRSAFLFNSPQIGRRAYEMHTSNQEVPVEYADSYFADVPEPYYLHELNREKLEKLITVYGPDLMRANFISGNLVDTDRLPLVTGGACALETWATRLLNKKSLIDNPSLRRELLLYILDHAPYYSHITGAMMLGAQQDISLIYDETFPWFMTIFDIGQTKGIDKNKWNMEIVKHVTRELYDRIYGCVTKRNALITNKKSRLLRLPFEVLRLGEDGLLEEWYSEYMGNLQSEFKKFIPTNYDAEKFIGAYVRYTYVGPEILKLIKNKLECVAPELDKFKVHVRTKQDDHLSEGRRINRILLRGLEKDDEGFLQKYANICDLAIYFWHKNNWQNRSTGFIGFSDFSHKGNIIHDTIDLNTGKNTEIKNEEQLWDLVQSPLRLNRRNITEHFEYLEKYLDSSYIHEEAAKEIRELESKIKKSKKRLDSVTYHKNERELIKDILTTIIPTHTSPTPELSITHTEIEAKLGTDDSVNKLNQQLNNMIRRYHRRSGIIEIVDNSPLLDNFTDALSINCTTDKIHIELDTKQGDFNALINAFILVINEEINTHRIQETEGQATLNNLETLYKNSVSQVPYENLQKLDLSPDRPTILPLKNNLIFTHAIQLAFDANIACFIIDAEKIENSNSTLEAKKRMLIKACKNILPRIKGYLVHIMDDGLAVDTLKANYSHYQAVIDDLR